jgi:cellulose synthase/poly-beta-1,6-N-acetylglucosamine synthase-like glycosyltransferase
VAVLPSTYLALLTAAAIPRRRRRAFQAPTTRFAVLVPAHDEEAVIGDTLSAFHRLEYAEDLFEVHVVADNCSDRTANIVRDAGWFVHERDAPDHPGKGPALNWLFDRLDDRAEAFDVAVIVDADSVVDRAFLAAMDDAFQTGAVAAQGYYSVRDPSDSISASLRYAALASRHHLRPLGRCRIGASAGLYGNGMAFDWSTLRRRRWTGHLVEDAELQMELLLNDGILITYVPEARVEAEMPASLQAATGQNERWERGRLQLVRRYVPRLTQRFVTGDGDRRIAYVDAIADHLLPPLSVLAVMQVANICGDAAAALLGNRRAPRRLAIGLLAGATLAAHVLVGLRSVEAPPVVYRSLIGAPKMILWKTHVWANALLSRREVTWTRTQRNVSL